MQKFLVHLIFFHLTFSAPALAEDCAHYYASYYDQKYGEAEAHSNPGILPAYDRLEKKHGVELKIERIEDPLVLGKQGETETGKPYVVLTPSTLSDPVLAKAVGAHELAHVGVTLKAQAGRKLARLRATEITADEGGAIPLDEYEAYVRMDEVYARVVEIGVLINQAAKNTEEASLRAGQLNRAKAMLRQSRKMINFFKASSERGLEWIGHDRFFVDHLSGEARVNVGAFKLAPEAVSGKDLPVNVDHLRASFFIDLPKGATRAKEKTLLQQHFSGCLADLARMEKILNWQEAKLR